MQKIKLTLMAFVLTGLNLLATAIANADVVKVKVTTKVISTGEVTTQTYMFPNFINSAQIIHQNDDFSSQVILIIGVNDSNFNPTTGVGDLNFIVTQSAIMAAQEVKVEVLYMLPTSVINGLTGGTFELTGTNPAPAGSNPVTSIIVDEELLPGSTIAYSELDPCGRNCKNEDFGSGAINIPVPEALVSYGMSSYLTLPENLPHVATAKLKLAKPVVCAADLDGDNEVDSADLAILLGAYGQIGNSPSDLNGDSKVDGADLGIILGSYGLCPQ